MSKKPSTNHEPNVRLPKAPQSGASKGMSLRLERELRSVAREARHARKAAESAGKAAPWTKRTAFGVTASGG